MIYRLKNLLLLLLWLSTADVYADIRGCVAVPDKDAEKLEITEVQLPEFKERLFQNDLVELQVSGFTQKIIENPENVYCYEPTDPRFAVVQAYYHATQALTYFNSLIDALDTMPLEGLKITLRERPDKPTSGTTTPHKIYFKFGSPAFDPSVLAHEVAHAVQFHLAKAPSAETLALLYKLDDQEKGEREAIWEGLANLLAAFFMGFSQVGKFDYPGIPSDVNSFVRFPDLVPRHRNYLDTAIHTKAFAERYPVQAADWTNLIADLEKKGKADLLNQPMPYLASAAFTQPLWLAADQFGKQNIEHLLLKTLPALNEPVHYKSFIRELLKQAHPFENIHSFLKQAFQIRGLPVEAS